MKNRGFIKLYRSVLSKPEMTDLVAEQGATGFGTYLMVVLYLSQCDDGEGLFTNGQLSALAAMAHKSRDYVRQIIAGYGLFEINGNRFRIVSESHRDRSGNQNSPAYLSIRAQEIDIEEEKENKEKSPFEYVAGGVRHASHGQPLPQEAPPQPHRNMLYSYSRGEWVEAEDFDQEMELEIGKRMGM